MGGSYQSSNSGKFPTAAGQLWPEMALSTLQNKGEVKVKRCFKPHCWAEEMGGARLGGARTGMAPDFTATPFCLLFKSGAISTNFSTNQQQELEKGSVQDLHRVPGQPVLYRDPVSKQTNPPFPTILQFEYTTHQFPARNTRRCLVLSSKIKIFWTYWKSWTTN